MMRAIIVGSLLAVFASATACAGNFVATEVVANQLGILPIGSVPVSTGIFVTTNCDMQEKKFTDCFARDAQGREYAFFDGALSRVTATQNEGEAIRLPAGLEFGENIESAAKKVASTYGVELDRTISHEGRIVYSSDFVIQSSLGIPYSIELVADEDGRLVRVVERTDF